MAGEAFNFSFSLSQTSSVAPGASGERLDPGSLQLGMPWMLKHRPEQPRLWKDEDVWRPLPVNTATFFRKLLVNLESVATSRRSDVCADDLVPARLAPAVSEIRAVARQYATGLDDWMAAWTIARETGERQLFDEILQP